VPWGTISRGVIVDAALRLGRGQGFQQMTIRSLAAELGVAPMSLYRHIAGKDDLLDEVVEVLLSRTWRAPSATIGWRTWITEAADSLRRLLVREPAALYVYQRRPVVSPTAVRRMETMLDVLRGAGLGDEAARHAYAAVHTYTVGFAALESSRSATSAPEGAGELVNQLAAYTTPQQFVVGLRYLLEGIEHLALVDDQHAGPGR
jgi:AcrR family transcriptional regulator